MRFRHKLTIMLVVLALVPLVASGLLATSLLRRNQIAHVDGRLGGAVSSGVVAYGDALRGVQARAVVLAHQKAVQDALTGKGDPQAVVAAPPPGLVLQLVSDGQVIAGSPPPGPAWKAEIAVGPASCGRQRDRVAAAGSRLPRAGAAKHPERPRGGSGTGRSHARRGLDRRRPRTRVSDRDRDAVRRDLRGHGSPRGSGSGTRVQGRAGEVVCDLSEFAAGRLGANRPAQGA